MEAEKRVIEDLLWSDVFSTGIVKCVLLAVGGVLFFRLIGQIRLLRQFKAFVYLTKALTYLFLVIMLILYFRKQGAADSINVFTGFTLLFSAIEVVDNFLLMFAEWQSGFHQPDDSEKKLFKKEEKRFNDLLKDLYKLKWEMYSQSGRVNDRTKALFLKISKKIAEPNFFTIDSILENKTGEKFYFTKRLQAIEISEMMRKIVRNARLKNPKSLSFKGPQHDQMMDALEKAIECRGFLIEEKYRLMKEKKNMDLM